MPVEASVAAILRATWPDLPRPGDDDAALGVANEIDRGGEGRSERALQRRRDRGDAAGFGVEGAQGRLHGLVHVIGPG